MIAAALSAHPVPAQAIGEVVGQVLERLDGPPDLAVLFATAPHTGAMEDMAAAVESLLEPVAFAGTTAGGVLVGEQGVEDTAAVALWAARFGGPVTVRGLGPGEVEVLVEGDPEPAVVLLVADPFSSPVSEVLSRLERDHPGLPVLGGLASAARGPGGNRLVVDGEVVASGAVAVLVPSGVGVRTVVSQGCRPIGRPFTVTRAEGQVLLELAGRPALERLTELVEGLDPDERRLVGAGLHLGLVSDEHKLDFERGDFLIRAVLAIDRRRGAIVVADTPSVGSIVQFQVRDADTAGEDLSWLLAQTTGAEGALLFTCNGRGAAMFGTSHHDARVLQDVLGPLPVAGMFAAGEIGPVGRRNALHGFTASVALFGATS